MSCCQPPVPSNAQLIWLGKRAYHPDLSRLSEEQVGLGLAATETLLLKAIGIPEWRKMILLENRLRESLWEEWKQRSARAARAAGQRLSRGKNPLTVKDADDAAEAARLEFKDFGKALSEEIHDAVKEAMELAVSATNKKAQGKYRGTMRYDFVPLRILKAAPYDPRLRSGFDVADEAAAEALGDDLTFWVGNNYDRTLAESVREIARTAVVESGDNPRAAGELLERELIREYRYDPANPTTGAFARIPVGWSGSARDYFTGVAANAATVGRVSGQLSTLRGVGATRYTIVNPLDERTCEVCRSMAEEGKSMPVEGAWGHYQDMIGATPKQVREVLHPWMRMGGMLSRAHVRRGWGKTAGGPGKMISAGFGYPPFHIRCRCTIDIAEDSEFADVDEERPR